MSLEIIERLYIENIEGRYDCAHEILESIKSLKYYTDLAQYSIGETLMRLFANYRENYRGFDDRDYQALNDGILRTGATLSTGMLLFHGRGAEPISVDRPISYTLDPSIAIWHARKHRNHEVNGRAICIYAMEVQCEELKACADFQCHNFGHELEVVLQARIKCKETRRIECMEGVFICEGNLSI